VSKTFANQLCQIFLSNLDNDIFLATASPVILLELQQSNKLISNLYAQHKNPEFLTFLNDNRES
jgi:hypothetical protein